MGSLVPLERIDSNSEDELESLILGDENPPKNQRIPWRRLEITNRVLEASPPGVLEGGRKERMNG
jgi:hypothetical protein